MLIIIIDEIMTIHGDNKKNLWTRYRSAIEDYQEFRDLEDILAEFRAIVASENPTPSVELLTEIANHFQKFKQISDAKKAFGRILQLNNTHRETWKQLSSLYFKQRDVRKGEFCLQKYYSLTGGNACLQKATELRLASSGKLKKLPSHQELGLQDGLTIQSKAPKSVITLTEFHNRFDIPIKDLPTPIQKIIQFAQHQIVDYRLFENQPGEIGKRIDILNDPNLVKALKKREITHFFQFQEEAITMIQKDQDVCIVAPTGNGKTEAFLLPTLLKIREYKDCGVQLLLIYPMKALAKDQLRKIEDFASLLGLSV